MADDGPYRQLSIPRQPEPHSPLVEVILDALRFAEEEGRVLLAHLHELLDGFHRGEELSTEFLVLGILPGLAERGKAALQRGSTLLHVGVEAFELRGEAADLLGIHDCLGHAHSIERPRSAKQ